MGDSVASTQLSIKLTPLLIESRMQAIKSEKGSFPFLGTAMACSIIPFDPKEVISKIQISSNQDFSPDYPAGTDLITLFQALIYHNSTGHQFVDIDTYISR
ncbi:MAG: hypothetical protein LAT68_08595 [Cyclobacteriaceae bacterium]|nr:hypothetical protein [Cyclobacteriaceae bacterium]MCH8516375.1 hypothetical protein [Cyclobacteriaceae bacterium]